MSSPDASIPPSIAIVDMGMGNLLSARLACAHAGMSSIITSSGKQINQAQGVILPGVGAFRAAMDSLQRLDLIYVLKEYAQTGKPLIGICLGMQLLFDEGFELGHCPGLGLIGGNVVKFATGVSCGDTVLKIPHVGWCGVRRPSLQTNTIVADSDPWLSTPLESLPDGASMYFNHSFYAQVNEPLSILSTSHYGNMEFTSSVRKGNLFGFQFHPERSGPEGLRIFENLAKLAAGVQAAAPQ